MFPRLLAIFAILWPLQAAADGDLVGFARVIDGDTLEVAGEKVRLFGIDAPERPQGCELKRELWDCGVASGAFLLRLTLDNEIRCTPKDRDRYGRIVAVCWIDDWDVGREMVRQGWAMAYRQYSTDYVHAETMAKMERVGLWEGRFVPPWEYRRLIRENR